MALGRQRERQSDILVSWAELPRSPGHAFYDKLQTVLIASDFDRFVEMQCASEYAPRHGRPSLPPGRYFRMLLVGYFEGIDSERGLEWRCADSLSLREFLRLGTTGFGGPPAVPMARRAATARLRPWSESDRPRPPRIGREARLRPQPGH